MPPGYLVGVCTPSWVHPWVMHSLLASLCTRSRVTDVHFWPRGKGGLGYPGLMSQKEAKREVLVKNGLLHGAIP